VAKQIVGPVRVCASVAASPDTPRGEDIRPMTGPCLKAWPVHTLPGDPGVLECRVTIDDEVRSSA
jgi:hypothetical protein